MPFANPNCPRCHGGGEVERIEMRDGIVSAFIYEPCPCTFRSQWIDEEDWVDDRRTGSNP